MGKSGQMGKMGKSGKMGKMGALVVTCLFGLLGVPSAFAQGTQNTQNTQNRQGTATTPVAGVSAGVIGIAVDEVVTVASGWSIKNQMLGKQVQNDKGEKIGKVEDIIVRPDNSLSYAIIGVGGFLGMGRHDVAVPMKQLKLEQGKFVLAGATKDVLKGLPEFQYAKK